MPIRIGFVVLTHDRPPQIQRLIERLNAMFEHPPIVCHHDFGQCPMPIDGFAHNVSFVPSLATRWGTFSLVEAAIRAIQAMFRDGGPDWFVLLSGADYPIKSAATIRGALAASEFDAHIAHTFVGLEQEPSEGFARLGHWRYRTARLFPAVRRDRVRGAVRFLDLRRPWLASPLLPFSSTQHCYAGEFWFCANRRAAQYIVDYHATHPALAEHYRNVPIPEESYFQTVLVNAPGLEVHNDDLRYIDWSNGGHHPKVLTHEDLPRVLAAPDHFARKVDLARHPDLLDALDRALDAQAT